MAPPIIVNENLIPEKFRNGFGPLVEKINDLEYMSIAKPLTGGFSESVPLLVYANYKNKGTLQVFKVGEKSIINDEARNWDDFIKNGPYEHLNVVHKKEHAQGSPHSLIVYNFAGCPGKDPITFEELYKIDTNPEDTLKHLFGNVLRPFSDEIKKGKGLPQIVDILKIDSENLTKITEKIKRLSCCNDICTIPKIKINGEELYNPLYFYPFNASLQPKGMAIPVPNGIVHGDLNARNILFYQTKAFTREGVKNQCVTVEIPCIIDYAHTGEKSLYTDIAKLESVLKFQLLEVANVAPNILLQFEDKNILRNLVAWNQPPITDPHLQNSSLASIS